MATKALKNTEKIIKAEKASTSQSALVAKNSQDKRAAHPHFAGSKFRAKGLLGCRETDACCRAEVSLKVAEGFVKRYALYLASRIVIY